MIESIGFKCFGEVEVNGDITFLRRGLTIDRFGLLIHIGKF